MDELPDLDFELPLPRSQRTIILFKGSKRVQFSAQDLNVNRAASIFKVIPDTLYLEDESRKTFFPNASGSWDMSNFRHFGNYSVEGEDEKDVHTPIATTSADLPSLDSPSSSNYFKTLPWKPSATPSTRHFINPKRKSANVRKQIFLAEYDLDGKPSVTGAVYITIQEGKTQVEDVVALLKETLNSDDDFTLTDVKGLEILDSDSVNCLQFWKSSAKKILAIKSDEFIQMQIGREFGTKGPKGKKRAKQRRDCGSSSPDERINTKKMDEMQQEICSKLDSLSVDLSNQMTNLSGKMYGIDQIGNKIIAISEQNNVVLALIKLIECKICLKIPKFSISVASCCQQIIGCGECIQEWVLHNDTCILCKEPEVSVKLMQLKGFEKLLSLITGGGTDIHPV